MVELRHLRASDLDDLYSISLATGHIGRDAAKLYDDPRMMGHIYSAPYAALAREMCFVAEDDAGVAGFVVGTLDTEQFEITLEKEWWPILRAKYPSPDPDMSKGWTADQKRCHMIHNPKLTPQLIKDQFPAHLHMNLLPKLQGRRLGAELLQIWISAAVTHNASAAHVGVNPLNYSAIKFWQACGFRELNSDFNLSTDRTIWLGRFL